MVIPPVEKNVKLISNLGPEGVLNKLDMLARVTEGGVVMGDEKNKNLKRTKMYKDIREDMLRQLEKKGISGQSYTDLIEDYMDFWVTKCMLIADIHSRGISVEYNNGGGQKGIKKNDSVEQLIKVNGQMLKLRAALGIDVPEGEAEEDERL